MDKIICVDSNGKMVSLDAVDFVDEQARKIQERKLYKNISVVLTDEKGNRTILKTGSPSEEEVKRELDEYLKEKKRK